VSELRIEEGKWYRRRDGRVVGPAARLTGDQRWYFGASGEWYRGDGRCVSWGGTIDLVEEVPAPLPSAMTAADLWSEIDRLQSEIDARMRDVKTRPCRVPPSGKDDVEEASADTLPRRAVDIAGKAASLVGSDRDRQHGAKHDNFRRIAGVWNAWLAIRKDPSAPLDAHDVGCMMALMKLARTQSGALNVDDYVDACGYAACAGEVAQINIS